MKNVVSIPVAEENNITYVLYDVSCLIIEKVNGKPVNVKIEFETLTRTSPSDEASKIGMVKFPGKIFLVKCRNIYC